MNLEAFSGVIGLVLFILAMIVVIAWIVLPFMLIARMDRMIRLLKELNARVETLQFCVKCEGQSVREMFRPAQNPPSESPWFARRLSCSCSHLLGKRQSGHGWPLRGQARQPDCEMKVRRGIVARVIRLALS
jgi:hypothetical protein